MSKTVRAEKVDKKIELFVLFPCSLPELWSLNCLNSARNLSLLNQFKYMYLQGLVMQFLENGTAYYAMSYCFRDIRVQSREILLNFC